MDTLTLDEKQKRALRRRNKARVDKKREELVKTLNNKDKFIDYKKHTIKRLDGNPRKAGIKTAQEVRAEEAFDSQLEDADLISDAAAVEFLVDEALTKAQDS